MSWKLTDQSLCQIAGISPELEIELNHRGVHGPREVLLQCEGRFSPVRMVRVRESVARFARLRELELTDAIVNAFPCGHRVRVVQDRYRATCFLDVETDECTRITVVTTVMGGFVRTFTRGQNLDDFLLVWKDAEIVVTFNGKRFDIPVLRREFGFTCVPAHVDLMDEARHYGLAGGLKAIEKRIAYARVTEGMSGEDAPGLWKKYCETGDQELLGRLVCYNQEDTLSLVALFRHLLPLSLENMVFDN